MIKQITDRCQDFPQIGEKMDTKFTPGPWFVVKGDEWTSDIATETPKQGVWSVASVNIRRDESDANKHLIAAAPDMYEFAERVLYVLGDDPDNKEWERTLVGHAKEVLAKARGE